MAKVKQNPAPARGPSRARRRAVVAGGFTVRGVAPKVPPGLRWHSFLVDGRPSAEVKRATDLASGAYAVRRKDSKGVVYVGESHVGHLWRTLNRHFQAPASLLSTGNAFATDRPGDYEVAWVITSRGKLAKANADQRAMAAQARWIAAFRGAGHRLHNRDAGTAKDEAREWRETRAAQAREEADRPFFANPAPSGGLTELGKLTRLSTKSQRLAWSLRDAPVLAYDRAGKLFFVYVGKVVRPSNAAELKEYRRTHWGRSHAGGDVLRDGGIAPGPYTLGETSTSITYTTQKGTDPELVDYVHEWGEGARGKWTAPRVAQHVCHRCGPRCAARDALTLVGGSYVVNDRGIVG